MIDWIPEEEWKTVVQYSPVASVDIVVECPEGYVLGKRTNKPAQGEWFVPGGRIRKGERVRETVHRIASCELNTSVEIRRSLGVFDHFYTDSELGLKKHYVANGFHVWTEESSFELDDQHSEIAIFEEVPTKVTNT